MIPAPISDFEAQALALLTSAYAGQPVVEGLVKASNVTAPALEKAIWDCINSRVLGTSTGNALDILGTLVGQPRNGLADADYTRLIRIKIAVNNSRGNAVDMTLIVKLLANGGFAQYTEVSPGVFRVEFEYPATGLQGMSPLIALLNAAKLGGARMVAVNTAGIRVSAAYFSDDLSGPSLWANNTDTNNWQDDY